MRHRNAQLSSKSKAHANYDRQATLPFRKCNHRYDRLHCPRQQSQHNNNCFRSTSMLFMKNAGAWSLIKTNAFRTTSMSSSNVVKSEILRCQQHSSPAEIATAKLFAFIAIKSLLLYYILLFFFYRCLGFIEAAQATLHLNYPSITTSILFVQYPLQPIAFQFVPR